MKSIYAAAAFFFFALIVSAPRLGAETPSEHDLHQLRADHDVAVATALDPINRHYKDALEKLLKKANQAGELLVVRSIQEELQAVGRAAPAQIAVVTPASAASPAPNPVRTASPAATPASTTLPAADPSGDTSAAPSGPLKDFLPGTTWVPYVASMSKFKSIHFVPNGKGVMVTTNTGTEGKPVGYEIAQNDKEVITRWSGGQVMWSMKIGANRKALEFSKERFKLQATP